MSKMVSKDPEFEKHSWSKDGVHFSSKGGKVFSDVVLSKLSGPRDAALTTRPSDTSPVEIPAEIETTGVQDWKKGKFVHGWEPADFPEFDFDKFYKELDTQFAARGGAKGMLSDYGKDWKFGREHYRAYKELQKAKTQEPLKITESEFQRKMKINLKKEHEWLLDRGPQDPGAAFSTKRVGGESNAFIALEQKGIYQPGVYDPFKTPRPKPPEDWSEYEDMGALGKPEKSGVTPWPEDPNPSISKARRGLYDSYTSGPNRQAWEEKVGADMYERDILPQIQHVVKNVPIKIEKIGPSQAGLASHDKIQVAPEYGQDPETIYHELAHIVDQHFNYKLSREQKGKLEQLIDPQKLQKYSEDWDSPAEWAKDPAELEAEVLALRNVLGRRITLIDVSNICSGRSEHGTHLEKYLNCDDIQKTTNILNSIVKVDTPAIQQKQMVAEEQIDEISAMAAGSVEGAAAASGGPWQDIDVEKENKKQAKNAKISHGTALAEEEEFIKEVLDYLLTQMEKNNAD